MAGVLTGIGTFIVGGTLGAFGLLALGTVLVAGLINYGVKEKAKIIEQSVPKKKKIENNTPIYRYGGTNPVNLTPSINDVSSPNPNL